MSTKESCPRCGGQELYVSELVPASGHYGPSLLPGIGGWPQLMADAASRTQFGKGGNGWRRL
jgi:hypothetical protein